MFDFWLYYHNMYFFVVGYHHCRKNIKRIVKFNALTDFLNLCEDKSFFFLYFRTDSVIHIGA